MIGGCPDGDIVVRRLSAGLWTSGGTTVLLSGVSKSAVGRIIDRLGPMLALQPRQRFAKDIVLIVDGTLVPTRGCVLVCVGVDGVGV
ncbi:hypothetical protein B7C62_34885 [Kitasatospora albolonga]|uniref:Transposase IS701-like DDE domain-containing protein n=1 Tax=Kitasatospora albolonga TaxID=68173 RepID=A0ABC8C364_9ACTN|nr:hypothetical protein B7C62_34885 [Kitasatospora albolonga]